jgi:hypothetical protein
MNALWEGATEAVFAVDRDLRLRPVADARVNVTFTIEGEAAAPTDMCVARFGSWVVDMGTDVDIVDVRLLVPAPTPLVIYGRGHDDEHQCWIEDGRGAAQLLLRPVVLSYFTSRSPEGSRLRDALNAIPKDKHPWKPPKDGAVVAVGATFEVLAAEAAHPTTTGEPVGWWWVAKAFPPFAPKARGHLPPIEGPSRQSRIRTAATARVSSEAYYRTRPSYPGSHDRQIAFDDGILPNLGRIVTPEAAKEHRARRTRVLGPGTLTPEEYEALSDADRVTLNNIAYGRVGWRQEQEWDEQDPMPEKDPRLLRQTFGATKYRGGSQTLWVDVTGDRATDLASGVLKLPTAATLWTLAGMPKDQVSPTHHPTNIEFREKRPFANTEDVRGAPMASRWPPASKRPENRGSFNLDDWPEPRFPEFRCAVCMQMRPVHQHRDGDRCVDCWDAGVRLEGSEPGAPRGGNLVRPHEAMGNVAVTAGAELLARLLEAGLTERQAVVLLGTQAGWTAEEIHEALKVSRSTVESHLAAARKILKKNLSGD